MGWIYFIGDGELVKIGYSADDPGRRLEQLQTGNPRPLRLIAQYRGERYHERYLHQRFDGHHVRGEWFQLTPEILAFLSQTSRLN
jgi:hypothetical protein